MALCGIRWSPGLGSVETGYFTNNLLTRLVRHSFIGSTRKATCSFRGQCWTRVRCLASNRAASPIESEENSQNPLSVSTEEEFGHVKKFKMSNFTVCDFVSIGLGGRVLKKLAHCTLMYHSYSLQVYGYVSSPSGQGSFTLVHGYHGSFSLRHWLQQSDWLPTLEATPALDEESVRKVGDDTIGGPSVTVAAY